MAARETQGLQIALIIFVGLTLILGVTTFWYFRSYEDQFARAESDDAARRKAETALATMDGDFREVKRLLGVAPQDTREAIIDVHEKDMKRHGANFPESKQTYRNLVDYLHVELDKALKRVAESEAREGVLKVKIDTDRADREKEMAKYAAGLEASKKDLESERGNFKGSEERMLGEKASLSKLLDQRGKDLDDKTKAAATLEQKLGSRYTDLADRYKDLKEQSEIQLTSSEIADGRVTWVSQRQKTVYINLGSADGLRRQILFSVLGVDENNPVKAKKKGSVEVTRILDQHLAEARVVDDEVSNPIMNGDQIFSQVWQPGRALRFALAGFMDIDGDNQSDRKRIRDIIVQNGGIIDAEVADDGKKSGTMTINTHYLVLGDDPVKKISEGKEEKGSPAAAGYQEFENEAKTLPVKRMAVADFLDLMGYRAELRTIKLGGQANPRDFKPTLPDGIQRKSDNKMFPPRTPRPRPAPKTAY